MRIKTFWTELLVFLTSIHVIGLVIETASLRFAFEHYILQFFVFGFFAYFFTDRLVGDRLIAVVLTSVGVVYWSGLLFAAFGAAYAIKETTIMLPTGILVGVVLGLPAAYFAYRARQEFEHRLATP